MPIDAQILAAGQSDLPLDYEVPNAQEILLKACNGNFDGSGAAGAFLPAIVIESDGGLVISRVFGTSVAAGASAEVSFFPGGRRVTTGGTSTSTAPDVATFYRSAAISGDPGQSIPAGSDANITWLHAALPSNGDITGPTIGSQYITFNVDCITIEFLHVQWEPGTFSRSAVLGTQSRIIRADEYAFSNDGAAGVAADGVSTLYETTHHPNAHIATDLLHAYVTNGDAVARDVVEAFLVIYAWPISGYNGAIPGWPQ